MKKSNRMNRYVYDYSHLTGEDSCLSKHMSHMSYDMTLTANSAKFSDNTMLCTLIKFALENLNIPLHGQLYL